MDPRLWQILNTSPGELYIREISLSHQGKSLILDCETFNENHPNGRRFRLTFSRCRDVHWQASDPHSNEAELTQALGMYLGEELHTKPAVVYTGGTEMSVLYDEIRIEE